MNHPMKILGGRRRQSIRNLEEQLDQQRHLRQVAITELKGLHDRRTKAQRLVDQMAICDVVGASEKDNYAVVRVPLDLWNEVHDVMADR